MTWTMPRPILQLVALALGLVCLGSFAVGVITAQPPARLPGEVNTGGAPATVIEAQEAKPLVEERIEGPPAAPELTDEERERLEAEKAAKEEAARKAEAEKAAAMAASVQPVLQTPVEPVEKVTPKAPPAKAPAPKAEEPPF